MGEHVEVQLRNGTVPQTVEGILHVCSLGDRADGAFDVVLRLPSSQTRHISSSHIVQLTARSYPVGERKRGGEFATDTDISGRPNAGRVRDLEAVDSSWFTGPAVGDGLSGGIGGANSTFHQDDGLNGKGGGRGGGGRKWDQFEANKRLFNVTSTFDENLYTTPLDRSKVTTSQQRTAERIALEIESGMSTNSHMREERNQQTEQDNDMDEEERYGGVIGTGGLAMHHMSAKTGGTAALLAAARAESGGLGSGSRSPQTPTEFTSHSNSGGSGIAYRPPAVRKAEATQHATQQAKHQLQDVLSGKLKSSNTADAATAAAVTTATSDTTDSNGGATVTASVSDIENIVDKADSTSVAAEGTTAAATTGTTDATADSKTTGTVKKAEIVGSTGGTTSTTESPVVKKDSDVTATTPTISTAKVASPSTATTTTTSTASTTTTAAATIAKKSTLTLNAKAKEFKPSGFKATAKEFVPGGASVSTATSTASTIMSPPPLHTTGTLRRNSISSNSGANVSPTPGHHTPTHHHQQQHIQHSVGHQQHHQQHHTSPHHATMDHTHHQQHLQQSPLHHQHVPGMIVDPNMVSNQRLTIVRLCVYRLFFGVVVCCVISRLTFYPISLRLVTGVSNATTRC
jgi:LsmAD domain